MKKMYCLVVTDDYSRFTWVFFLATKDETIGILKSFITEIENLVDHKVKVIRCDNGTEFKNKEMNQFCKMKGILRQFSVARTPQQNGVAERRNRTLIEAARTMLADSKLPTTFWAEAVNTACYVQNRVLVVKPHNKTPYELFHDHLGKFDGKADEGFFVGYSLNSKAFRVFNSRTRVVEENLHIRFSESTPNVVGTQSNGFAGTKVSDNAGQARKETEPIKNYILLPLWTADPPFSQDPKSSHDDGFKPSSDDGKKDDEDPRKDSEFNAVGRKTSIELPFDPNMPTLEDVIIFDFSRDDDDVDHPLDQVIGDLQSATLTRKMSKNLKEHGFEEPKKIIHALKDPSWIEAMQEELLQFKLQKAWTLVDLPNGKGLLALNGFSGIKRMKEEIIEAIRLFLAYASFKDFVVYQMDVKSDFLYGKIEEEVYVCQPPGFEDPDFLDRVYKVEKALYKGDILLVQVYVDDIIFGSTKKELYNAFEKLMHEKFQMSSIGELTFFLGLQKFGFTEVKTTSTPMETQKRLLKDEDCKEVDVHIYRSINDWFIDVSYIFKT
ncbi:retrovirus-related pol polyprotein from transposon TNT 1-94 [Tanacetum coccineum]